MINSICFTKEILVIGITNNLESHNNKCAQSILTITPIYPGFGNETRYNNKNLKEMATIYARMINQYRFKNHIIFSAFFTRLMKKIEEVIKMNYFLV